MPSTLSRWRGVIAAGLGIAAYTLLRTACNGWIELSHEGDKLRLGVRDNRGDNPPSKTVYPVLSPTSSS